MGGWGCGEITSPLGVGVGPPPPFKIKEEEECVHGSHLQEKEMKAELENRVRLEWISLSFFLGGGGVRWWPNGGRRKRLFGPWAEGRPPPLSLS